MCLTMKINADFIERTTALFGKERFDGFMQGLESAPVVSIRYNEAKTDMRPAENPVPWASLGCYLPTRPVFTADPHFHAGCYYVQEASSMFLEQVVRQYVTSPVRALDLCAAPGGKTTNLLSALPQGSMLVSNEPVPLRAQILAENVVKWGRTTSVVTRNEPADFSSFRNFFDIIVVDAPCSGEGMFRKDEQAREEWSEGNVRMCAARQAEILDEAWKTLADGGLLIYSTCTFNSEENEGSIRALTERVNGEIEAAEAIECPAEWGVVCGREGVWQTFRFYPHRTQSEGFFAAVARKASMGSRRITPKPRRKIMTNLGGKAREELSRWVENPKAMRFAEVAGNCYGYYADVYEDVKHLAESLSVIYSGVEIGRIFGTTLKPDAALAFFAGLRRDAVPRAVLDREEALQYLRKQDVAAERFTEGMNLVECEGCALGFAKRIGNRCNNLFPNSLRILK